MSLEDALLRAWIGGLADLTPRDPAVRPPAPLAGLVRLSGPDRVPYVPLTPRTGEQ